MRRRDFLHSAAVALAAAPRDEAVVHVLPTVSDTRILLKASFRDALTAPPSLAIDTRRPVPGRRTDSHGRFWSFDARGLEPSHSHTLQLADSAGKLLGDSWKLRTFPSAGDRPQRLRLAIYTCAGGPEGFNDAAGRNYFLPVSTRRRLLARLLSFQPDALIAIGDHVYWDLRSNIVKYARSEQAIKMAGTFDRRLPVLGSPNEAVLQRVVSPQIADVYGTLCRSTPVFFIQDDHDYFDNDEATDSLVTFPPDDFMLRLARATRLLYYPEFLPHATRPAGLPGSFEFEHDSTLSECYGTLRFGNLAEALLYDCRRYLTLAGATARYVAETAEQWLMDRTAAVETAHLMHVPSMPFGWSAGKWGEWYSDILESAGRLTTAKPKPYWQTGWRAQHDRILGALTANRHRAPVIVSGDLHSLALAQISGGPGLDLRANPVTTIVAGPLGTGRTGWPSSVRGTRAQPASGLEIDEKISPIENNGFTLVDFTPDKMRFQFYRWSISMGEDAIASLAPFHTEEIARP